MRAPGGAVASWASSGQSAVRGQAVLLAELLATLLTDSSADVTLGQAVLAAKLQLYGAGGGAYAEALDTFHLLGDPALVLREAAPPATPAPSATAAPPATPAPADTPTASPAPLVTAPAPGATPIAAPPSPFPAATPPLVATPTPTRARIFLPVVQVSHDPPVMGQELDRP